MNAQAVKQEIQNIIANRYRKQHAPAKWQIAKAAELGLTDILADFGRGMKLGHSDYTAILDAAADSGKTSGGMTADLEWSESTAPASALYKLLNEVEPVEIIEGFFVREGDDVRPATYAEVAEWVNANPSADGEEVIAPQNKLLVHFGSGEPDFVVKHYSTLLGMHGESLYSFASLITSNLRFSIDNPEIYAEMYG